MCQLVMGRFLEKRAQRLNSFLENVAENLDNTHLS